MSSRGPKKARLSTDSAPRHNMARAMGAVGYWGRPPGTSLLSRQHTAHGWAARGVVGAYHYGEFCRFLEDGGIPSPCRVIFLETLEVHTCRKNPRKGQKLDSVVGSPPGFAVCGSFSVRLVPRLGCSKSTKNVHFSVFKSGGLFPNAHEIYRVP